MTLSILIWVPVGLATLAALLLPQRLAKVAAIAWSIVTVGIAAYFLARFEPGVSALQFVTDDVWISSLGIHYKLGLDGLNVLIVFVATAIFAAAILWASFREWDRPRLFYFMFGLAESGVLGAFCAQDLALFIAFFDLMLIPFYFLAGIWGGPDRIRATTKLVVYTLIGSFFMLVGTVATGVLASSQHGRPLTFVLSSLHALPLSHTTQLWVFGCFAVAFLVKMPLVPFHGWLPDGYKAMPIPAIAVFSAILSKVAAYGFLRIVLPLFPYAAVHFQLLMLIIALASILWGTVVAMTQPDARLVVAYSSVAQLGFIVLGIFSLDVQGGQGAVLQMANHALVTAPLFFLVAMLALRAGGSEKLADMGGIAFRAPIMAGLFLIVTLATLAMPGSANFIGEFNILLGVFSSTLPVALVASIGVVGAAAYALRLYIRSMHNRVGANVISTEIGIRDAAPLTLVLVMILALAFFPQFGLARSQATVRAAMASPQAVIHGSSAGGTVAARSLTGHTRTVAQAP
ncbi:MAG TPA: NADH-quinone oxidoreductase subunit M [Solirubrobacteraceae bacterium]|nr:NADH-quinone oxidoreductase subunit M [Solirubrobacteraceae bacterium]